MTSHNAFEREHVLSRTNEFTRCSNTGTIVHRIRITNLGHLECDELVTYIQIGRVVPSGIAEDGTGFLVTEFMDGGSLDRALWAGEGGENVSTSWTQRIQILLDVVDALGYLHLYHKSIHQDLKSSRSPCSISKYQN